MAGIYIHVPFCKQACHYCDFHFTTNLKNKADLLQCLLAELKDRKDYLAGEPIESIYLGGGTPSLLAEDELELLLNSIHQLFAVNQPEITIEVNPDDLSKAKLAALKSLGFNRLSIGIQSFDDRDLKLMNRAHTGDMALKSLKLARDAGFDNISMDLIYGIPNQSLTTWKKNIQEFLDFNIPHLSAYALTYEDKTAFGNWVKKGRLTPAPEIEVITQFEHLIQQTKVAGFKHYEISNFAINDQFAKHNTSYWKSKNYLGIGPSAHSFNGVSRSWNVSNNARYIKNLTENESYSTTEILSINDRFNEYVLTTLRTMWGTNLKEMESLFGSLSSNNLLKEASPHLEKGLLLMENDTLFLSEKGKLVADKITSDLFQI